MSTSTLTFRSRVLSVLFNFFIGHPSSLKMPHDFAVIEEDRPLPAPNQLTHERKIKRIYVDHVRRAVLQKVANWMFGLALIVTIVMSLIGGATTATLHTVHGWMGHPDAPSMISTLNDKDRADVNTFLQNASAADCATIAAKREQVKAFASGHDMTMMNAAVEACHAKFGDQAPSSLN